MLYILLWAVCATLSSGVALSEQNGLGSKRRVQGQSLLDIANRLKSKAISSAANSPLRSAQQKFTPPPLPALPSISSLTKLLSNHPQFLSVSNKSQLSIDTSKERLLKLPRQSAPAVDPVRLRMKNEKPFGLASLLERSHLMAKSSIEEQLEQLTGVPHTGSLSTDANEEVTELEKTLGEESLAEEKGDQVRQKSSRIDKSSIDSLSAEHNSLSAKRDQVYANIQSLQSQLRGINHDPVPTSPKVKAALPPPQVVEASPLPAVLHNHLFDLSLASTTPVPADSHGISFIESKSSDEIALQRLNQDEVLDQQLLKALRRRARTSLDGANKVFKHVEDHVYGLERVSKQLNDEVALLSLKEKQMVQDRENNQNIESGPSQPDNNGGEEVDYQVLDEVDVDEVA